MIQISQSHISEELLERYAFGKLPETESEPVEEHLLICHSCQDRLSETDNFVKAFREASEQLAAQPAKVSFWQRWAVPTFRIPHFALVPALAGLAAVAVMVQIMQTNQAPQELELNAYRSAGADLAASANRPIRLRLAAEGLRQNAKYQIQVVSSTGKPVWTGAANWEGDRIVATVDQKLAQGEYWVRLNDPEQASTTVREYQLVTR